MNKFHPDIILHRASDITEDLLYKLKIKVLVLDVDNTLTTHNNEIPDNDILLWLSKIKKTNIHLIIMSNNTAKRVKPFANALKLDYTANAFKPFTHGFKKISAKLNVKPHEMAIVGDQIFTDVLAGNIFGCRTILVMPMSKNGDIIISIKRRLEKIILKNNKKYNRYLKNYAKKEMYKNEQD